MRSDWDETWLRTAVVVGARSDCARRQIGCVVVDANNRILATGYNGPPPGYNKFLHTIKATGSCLDYCQRSRQVTDLAGYTDCPALHAEANALSYTDPIRAIGGTAYVNGGPCVSCAKLLAGAQLSRVVYSGQSIPEGDELLKNSGIKVAFLNVTPLSTVI